MGQACPERSLPARRGAGRRNAPLCVTTHLWSCHVAFQLIAWAASLPSAGRALAKIPCMMVEMQTEAPARHVPGVSCFRTCRACRALASMPVPRPGQQLAAALEKGLKLGCEISDESVVAPSISPSTMMADLNFGICLPAAAAAAASSTSPVAASAPLTQQPRPQPLQPPPSACGACFDTSRAIVPATVALPCGHLGLCEPCSLYAAANFAVEKHAEIAYAICPVCRPR